MYSPLLFGGMNGDPDGRSLVSDGPADGLLDPPHRVRRELGAEPGVEAPRGSHKPEVPFLDEVGELEPAAHVATCHGDDEPQIALDQLLPRRFVSLMYSRGELRFLATAQDP